ncbi:hypothetical protein [Anaerococcus hydrogenalis]|nr:hypothetical protein [Anaerococcus hydrogenalis]
MPNYNMLWEEVKYGVKNGYKSLDLGGVFHLIKKMVFIDIKNIFVIQINIQHILESLMLFMIGTFMKIFNNK